MSVNKKYTHLAIPKDLKEILQEEARKRRLPMWKYLRELLNQTPEVIVGDDPCYGERRPKGRMT